MSEVKESKQKPRGAAALGAGPGRPKGSTNKTTRILRDAILEAASAVGHDGKGREGLTGYLKRVAERDIKAFATLLGKVLPMQITGEGGGPVQAVSMTPEEFRQIAAEVVDKV